jgi:transposase
MNIKVLGVDLGKQGCHVVGQDGQGKRVFSKQLSNKKFALLLGNLPPCRVLFEACGGAHYWARKADSHGHQSALIPAQFVKPFVKSNKNDWIDAEAICEAGQRPSMRYAIVRSAEQQALGALLKLRDGLISERTACINRAHAFLLEFGHPIRKGRGFFNSVTEILGNDVSDFPVMLTDVLQESLTHYRGLNDQIVRMEKRLADTVQASPVGKRLLTIPGIGIMTASYLLAWVGNGSQFRSSRDFAAWIGLVPKQCSTGGKTRLLGISKRGNSALRRYLIHGARSVIQWKSGDEYAWSNWIQQLQQRKPKPIVAVAVANKLARIVWAVLARDVDYDKRLAV